jgi:hypothetical protein
MLLSNSVGIGTIFTFHFLLAKEQGDARERGLHEIAVM